MRPRVHARCSNIVHISRQIARRRRHTQNADTGKFAGGERSRDPQDDAYVSKKLDEDQASATNALRSIGMSYQRTCFGLAGEFTRVA